MTYLIRFIKKVLPIVIALVLLQMFMVVESQAAPPAGGGGNYHDGQYYRVRYGDTLFSISRRFYVNPYQIARVNGLRNPNYIYAGQVLYIPSGGDCYSGCGRGYDRSRDYGQDCYSGCGRDYGRSRFSQGYGYDRTGYYYDANYSHGEYKRYSYTCGYYYNCY